MKTFETWYLAYAEEACREYGGMDCSNPQGIAEAAWDAAIEQSQADHIADANKKVRALESNHGTAKAQYDQCMQDCEEPSPVERLRFFCSFAMKGQDWFDVEPFINDLSALEAENARLTQERDEAISAVQRLSEGMPFDAIVIADGIKRATAQHEATLAQQAERIKELEKERDSFHNGMLKEMGLKRSERAKVIEQAGLLHWCFENLSWWERLTIPLTFDEWLAAIAALKEKK